METFIETFTCLAPEVAGLKEQDLRSTIIDTETGDNLSLCQVKFKRKHTLAVFIYLLSKVRNFDGVPHLTLMESTKNIVEGIGANPNSNSVRTQVNLSLVELHEIGIINLYSHPKKELSKYKVENRLVDEEIISFEEKKKHDHIIQLNKNFVYDKTCKFYIPMPDYIISHRELNYTDKLVYLAILKFSWSTSAKKATDFRPVKVELISEFLNLPPRTIKRSTQQLEKLGLIQKFIRTRKVDNSYQRQVKYIPLVLVLFDSQSKKLSAIQLSEFENTEVWEE